MEKFKQFITEETHPKDLVIGEYYKIYPLTITHPTSKRVSYRYYVKFETKRTPVEDIWSVDSPEFNIVIRIDQIKDNNSIIEGSIINPSKYSLHSQIFYVLFGDSKGNSNVDKIIQSANKKNIVYFSPEKHFAKGMNFIKQRYKLEQIEVTSNYDVMGDLF